MKFFIKFFHYREVVDKKNINSIINQEIPEPQPLGNHIRLENCEYWISKGSEEIKKPPRVSTFMI